MEREGRVRSAERRDREPGVRRLTSREHEGGAKDKMEMKKEKSSRIQMARSAQKSGKFLDLCYVIQEGNYLIIEDEAGVTYSNQTHGTSCCHPKMTGYLIPINGKIHHEENMIMNQRTVEAINEDLQRLNEIGDFGYDFAVDESRLAQCGEAWVYVIGTKQTTSNPLYVINGFGPVIKGVITCENSD